MVLVLVDCTNSVPADLRQKYGVSGFPTLMLTKPDGEKVRKASGRSVSALKADFKEMSTKYGMALPWEKSVKDAMAKAKKESKLTLVFFSDSKKKKNPIVEGFLRDKDVHAMLGDFVLVKHEVKKDCPVCEEYNVRKGPEMHLYDAETGKYVKKIRSFKTPAKLKKTLTNAKKDFDKMVKARASQ